MPIFGKKELAKKDAELEAEKSKNKKLAGQLEEMRLKMQEERESLELEKQEFEHAKELFLLHQSEKEQALKNQEAQMGQEIESRKKMLASQKAAFDSHLQKTTDEYDAKLKELEEKSVALDNAKIEFEPKLREAESGFAQKLANNERKLQERVTEVSQAI